MYTSTFDDYKDEVFVATKALQNIKKIKNTKIQQKGSCLKARSRMMNIRVCIFYVNFQDARVLGNESRSLIMLD